NPVLRLHSPVAATRIRCPVRPPQHTPRQRVRVVVARCFARVVDRDPRPVVRLLLNHHLPGNLPPRPTLRPRDWWCNLLHKIVRRGGRVDDRHRTLVQPFKRRPVRPRTLKPCTVPRLHTPPCSVTIS